MSTKQKGFSVDLTTLKPFPYDYRLCRFYTSLIDKRLCKGNVTKPLETSSTIGNKFFDL